MELFTLILATISSLAAVVSTITAVIALKNSEKTQKEIKLDNRKHATVEAFNRLQTEVLDDLVHVDKKNAETIIECLDDKNCMEAYQDYRTMIAKIEHFSVGVNEGVYDFEVTDKLAGVHLICLYPRIKPIIDCANRDSKTNEYYKNYVKLVLILKTIHPEIKTEE